MSFAPNGEAYDHSSHSYLIQGLPCTLIKEASFSQARDGEVYIFGTSRIPKARTFGKIMPGDLSLQIYYSDWELLKARLLLPDTGGIGGLYQRVWQFICTREVTVEGVPVVTSKDWCKDCRFKNIEKSSSEGGDATIATVTASCMLVLENGLLPTLDVPA